MEPTEKQEQPYECPHTQYPCKARKACPAAWSDPRAGPAVPARSLKEVCEARKEADAGQLRYLAARNKRAASRMLARARADEAKAALAVAAAAKAAWDDTSDLFS